MVVVTALSKVVVPEDASLSIVIVGIVLPFVLMVPVPTNLGVKFV